MTGMTCDDRGMATNSASRAVGVNLRRFRESCGWSAEKIASAMTMSGIEWTRQVVTKLENGGRRSVTVDELLALAKVLGVNDPITLTVAPSCETCGGRPPLRMRCMECGTETA